MTSQCRTVLSNLKKLTNNTECNISYVYGDTLFCVECEENKYYNYQKYESEIESIISSLIESGYLKYNYGNQYNFSLTQKGIHINQFTFSAIRSYFADKLIDILALIISIIALLKSYGYGVDDLINFCTKLLK